MKKRNPESMDTENVRTAFVIFNVHSECPEAYGTQHLQIFIPNAPRTRRMFPERFPYMPYAHILPEYTWTPHSDDSDGR